MTHTEEAHAEQSSHVELSTIERSKSPKKKEDRYKPKEKERAEKGRERRRTPDTHKPKEKGERADTSQQEESEKLEEIMQIRETIHTLMEKIAKIEKNKSGVPSFSERHSKSRESSPSKEHFKDHSKDHFKDRSKEVSKDLSKDLSKEHSKDLSKEVPKDLSKDLSKEPSKFREAPTEANKNRTPRAPRSTGHTGSTGSIRSTGHTGHTGSVRSAGTYAHTHSHTHSNPTNPTTNLTNPTNPTASTTNPTTNPTTDTKATNPTTNPNTVSVSAGKEDSEKVFTADVCKEGVVPEWESYGLKKQVLMGIKHKNFDWPSPIQAEAIPQSLAGRDIVARAKNGTGKTAAFIIPLLNKIDPRSLRVQALILVPTRELVLQTVKVVKELGVELKLAVLPLYGGVNPKDDIIRLKGGAQIVVGTPGRILDFIRQKVLGLEHCRYLICDEADKLLDAGFKEVVVRVTEEIAKPRQIELFSATFPQSAQEYIDGHMNNPIKLNLMQELTLHGIEQYYAYVQPANKLHCLKTLLDSLDLNQCFIFCNSIATVEKLVRRITEIGYTSYFIHSQMHQKDRNIVFHNFSTKGECRILVSTDLFTRGIDVSSVNVVINFDLPWSTESYLHRIGRCGRFGTHGIAINMVTPKEIERLQELERELGVELLPFANKM
ncbi:ATP-dependent RNA helicase DDX6/DHH1 [Nematocida sp. AWRm77]|nr:ATP-dependent RNA helicase DDX6/DHH1 [Nematocida sp. AWRm77]